MTDLQKPGDLIPALAAAYNEGRIESLLKLYDPDAVVVDKDGAEHRGREAVAQQLEVLLALKGTMTGKIRYELVYGDFALLSNEWRVQTKDDKGAPLVVSGRSAEVARRQADGRWLYVVDHPTGA